jgi:hypothetical protein
VRPVARGLLAALLVVCISCSGGNTASEETIDRETFVATYVDLRRATLRSPGQTLTGAGRERVLRENAVSEGELIDFAAAWGSDTRYMTGIWEEMGARLANPSAAPVE